MIEDTINTLFSKISILIKGLFVFVVGASLIVLVGGALITGLYAMYKAMSLVHWLAFIIAVLTCLLFVAVYYLYKFIKIIMVFEDDLSDTIETLNECEESLNHVISLRLFFENEQIRPILETAKNEVSMCRMKVRQMTTRFVDRSKQKYIIYEEPIEIEKVRGIPGTINESSLLGRYKRDLGDDADVVFATDKEITDYKNSLNKLQGF